MKRILLPTLIIILFALTGCTSALSHGAESSDDAHKFLLHIGQVTDQLDTDYPGEGKVFLIVKYEIENLRNQDDSQRQWTDQIKIEVDEETYEAVWLDSLADQMWETALSARETRTGYIAYTIPDDFEDVDLTFIFPVSEEEVLYVFRPVDRRIGVNADFVLTRLDQIERTKRIPVIGGLLAAISGASIRHLGEILVPEEEIDDLLEQTEGLSEEARRVLVEDYLLTHGHGQLE
ncbi:MAG TPA: hypothetical protein G4O18_07395 [Dehalococcoidia bacterium]|nr:hypothetical protein [Dehalococcoidia bacterium]